MYRRLTRLSSAPPAEWGDRLHSVCSACATTGRATLLPRRGLLELAGQRVQDVLGAHPTDQLHRGRQAVAVDSDRHRDRRLTGQVEDRGERAHAARDVDRDRRRSPVSALGRDRRAGQRRRHQHVELVPQRRDPLGGERPHAQQPSTPRRRHQVAPGSGHLTRRALELAAAAGAGGLLVDPAHPALGELQLRGPVVGIALADVMSELLEQPRRALVDRALGGARRRQRHRRNLGRDRDPQRPRGRAGGLDVAAVKVAAAAAGLSGRVPCITSSSSALSATVRASAP